MYESMKKEYISPSLKVMEQQLQFILAASEFESSSFGGNGVDDGNNPNLSDD